MSEIYVFAVGTPPGKTGETVTIVSVDVKFNVTLETFM